MARIDSQNDLFCQSNDSCFQVEGESVDTVRISFLMFAINIISDVNKLCRGFGLEWNFVSSRSGEKKIYCNRARRRISYVNHGISKSTSITCGCSWLIRFKTV